MRIAVPSQGDDLKAEVDVRFGRARNFLLVDTQTMSYQLIENSQNLNLPQGAGIQAAQNIIKHNPDIVLVSNCGPKAFRTLSEGNVKVVIGAKGTVSEVVEKFKKGEFEYAESANVEGHW